MTNTPITIDTQTLRALIKESVQEVMREELSKIRSMATLEVNTTKQSKSDQSSGSPSTEGLFGSMRGKVQYFEDLTAPTTDEWEEV